MALFKKTTPAVEATPAFAVPEATPARKKRGRPKGSGKAVGRPKGKLGRPKGSKNKKKGSLGRKPGRPAGTRDMKSEAVLKARVLARQVAKALKAQRKEQKALITETVDRAVEKALKQALR